MRAVVLRSLAVVGIGSLILAGVLYVASTVDGRPPAVAGMALTQALPDEPARGLPTTSFEVTFTEPVVAASAVDALTVEPDVEGAVSWSGSVMIFTPDEPLELATAYTVRIEPGVEDLAGNRMTEPSGAFAFETTGAPEVVETDPTDGASDVALEAPIAIRFSTLMDTASVEAALRLVPRFDHEIRWSGQLLEVLPAEPLRPETAYRLEIGGDAFDVSGVALAEPVRLAFETLSPGLDPALLVPVDGIDGVAPTSSIAVFFDRPIDVATITDEVLTISPDVAGSIELVDEVGDEPTDPEEARVLRFTPSGALPPNTTFEVVLAPAVTGVSGESLAEPITWTFTTGAPHTTLSNQITFLSDRGGVTNLWAMNVDGTAAHQLSTELTPIQDYAIAPDGSSFVVGDGRRLVMVAAGRGNRTVLTDEEFLEFDPTYAPNGQGIAFARADAATGEGLGIWERPIPGDAASPVELPEVDDSASPTPNASGEPGDPSSWVRAPRYSPDGEALAFVDAAGTVGIIDLETQDVTRADYAAQAPPLWLANSSAILVTGDPADDRGEPDRLDAPVAPLEPPVGSTVGVMERNAEFVGRTAFGESASAVAVAPDGRIAYLQGDATLRIAATPDEPGRVPAGAIGERIAAAAFAPGEDAIAVVVLRADDEEAGGEGSIERIGVGSRERDVLTNDGARPRWLP